MKKILLMAAIALAATLFSCSDEAILDSFNTGESFTDSNIRLINIDTFTINMATFKYDSLASSSTNRLLVGRYVDPVLGAVKATGFVEFAPYSYYIADNAVFDSIVLSMKYDGYFYNDTLQQKTVQVKELSKELRLRNDQTDFYNTSDIQASNTTIGQKAFYPKKSKDTLTIRLDDAFGQNLFSKFQNSLITDQDQMKDYFKGLKIEPDDTENAAIVGFSTDNISIKIYYSFPDDEDADIAFLKLIPNTSETDKFFNKIDGARAGTVIQNLGGQREELASSATANQTFIQSGIGITTKITLPHIRTISQVNGNNGYIFSSKLKIRLNRNNYSENLYQSDSLYVYAVDSNNDIKTQLTNKDGNYAVAYIDRVNTEYNEVYLIVPIEDFIEKTLANSYYSDYGIILLPFEYNKSTTRMVLNGENNPDYKSTLQLIYAIYDN